MRLPIIERYIVFSGKGSRLGGDELELRLFICVLTNLTCGVWNLARPLSKNED